MMAVWFFTVAAGIFLIPFLLLLNGAVTYCRKKKGIKKSDNVLKDIRHTFSIINRNYANEPECRFLYDTTTVTTIIEIVGCKVELIPTATGSIETSSLTKEEIRKLGDQYYKELSKDW